MGLYRSTTSDALSERLWKYVKAAKKRFDYDPQEHGLTDYYVIEVQKDIKKLELKQLKESFLFQTKETIKDNLPEADGITNKTLEEFVELADNGDWTNGKIIKSMYRKFHEVYHLPYDDAMEERLFKKSR